MKVVLASSSPRRALLFKQIGLSFTIDPSNVDESISKHTPPDQIVQFLASRKGMDVASRHEHSLIVAADTIVCLDQKILGKPSDKKEAREMLFSLSNLTHDVYSGVFVALTSDNGNLSQSFTFYERTKVTFSALTELEVDHYIKTGSPFDKAGAYGIQDDLGSLFVKNIDGDYYNVVGFPINAFYQHLKVKLPEVHQILFF
tara:strand:+ start:60075 stop:60677 length:603 start_codon:yes stop_codon:yes gene_type:complete